MCAPLGLGVRFGCEGEGEFGRVAWRGAASTGYGGPVIRSRFCCPSCGAALTPWLRELELAEAVNLSEDETWAVPGGWFVRRDAPLLAGTYLAEGATEYPWLLAPLSARWLRVHGELMRRVGCCGLSFGGLPNLLCACGAEVAGGYGDCIGAHWYALLASVVREQAADGERPIDVATRLARARELAGAPIAAEGCTLPRAVIYLDDPGSWGPALRLSDVRLGCGGGVGEPALVIESAQLPGGDALVLPIPWCQLVRLLVLDETPWADPQVPLTWKRGEGPQVQVARSEGRVLLTVWRRHESAAVTLDANRWTDAWADLRGR